MEMQGRGDKHFFADAGDGAMANLHRELMEMKRSQKRCQRILAALLAIVSIIVLALIIVVAIDAHRIDYLKQREGLLPHPNVTFASFSGDKTVDGLTYGGSLFRGSGFWSSRVPLPGKLTDHAAIAVDEKVYIIGGADVNGNVTAQVLLYDSILHNYTTVASMPQARYRFGAALDPTENKIYVVGGRVSDPPTNSSSGVVSTTFIYDIATNVWTQGADILSAGSDQCAAFLGGQVYMTGGYAPDYSLPYLSALQIYDIATDKWSYGPNMTTPRGDLMCTAFDGEMYAVGGYVYDNSSDQNSFTAAVESFNPNTSIWTTQPSLLTPRGDGAVTVLPGDMLMVVGGEGHYDNDQDFKYPKHTNEVFFAADKTWVEKAMIPTARFRTAAATAGGLAFVFGGADVCLDLVTCPALDVAEVYFDLDHPHVYIYLKNDAYNDNAALTTYPV
ncbi:unnamed protein product [Calypogeia fissa]